MVVRNKADATDLALPVMVDGVLGQRLLSDILVLEDTLQREGFKATVMAAIIAVSTSTKGQKPSYRVKRLQPLKKASFGRRHEPRRP